MMTLEERILLIQELKKAWSHDNPNWESVKWSAHNANAWFIPEYIETAVQNISQHFLDEKSLQKWIQSYPLLVENYTANQSKTVGIVMAGNLPLVGFHDFLACFIAGFKVKLKLSSKDTVLWNYIITTLTSLQPQVSEIVDIWPLLKNCDAYIATGSNNSAKYFEQYFSKYPHIIRKNRTSIAVLTGNESEQELEALAYSMHAYFGLGCRNISSLLVPEGYDFEHFIQHIKQFEWQRDHHKYKNNYDFQLAMFILNKVPYMSNEAMLFVENKELFAPISVVNYRYYTGEDVLNEVLNKEEELQCIETRGADVATVQALTSIPVVPLGQSQAPSLWDYADNVDTLSFLASI